MLGRMRGARGTTRRVAAGGMREPVRASMFSCGSGTTEIMRRLTLSSGGSSVVGTAAARSAPSSVCWTIHPSSTCSTGSRSAASGMFFRTATRWSAGVNGYTTHCARNGASAGVGDEAASTCIALSSSAGALRLCAAATLLRSKMTSVSGRSETVRIARLTISYSRDVSDRWCTVEGKTYPVLSRRQRRQKPTLHHGRVHRAPLEQVPHNFRRIRNWARRLRARRRQHKAQRALREHILDDRDPALRSVRLRGMHGLARVVRLEVLEERGLRARDVARRARVDRRAHLLQRLARRGAHLGPARARVRGVWGELRGYPPCACAGAAHSGGDRGGGGDGERDDEDRRSCGRALGLWVAVGRGREHEKAV